MPCISWKSMLGREEAGKARAGCYHERAVITNRMDDELRGMGLKATVRQAGRLDYSSQGGFLWGPSGFGFPFFLDVGRNTGRPRPLALVLLLIPYCCLQPFFHRSM